MIIMEHQNLPAEKLERLIKYLEYTPDNLNLLLEAIAIAMEIQDHNKAERLINQALGQYPDSAEINAHAGLLYLQQARFELALTHLSQATANGLTEEPVIYNLAYSQYQLHDFATALVTLTPLHDVLSLQKEVALLTARCRHNLGQIPEAIDGLKIFLATHAGDKDAEGLLAILFCDNDMFEEAIFYANQCLGQNASCFDALLARGSAYIINQQHDNAYADFQKALTINPQSGRAWSGLAQIDFYNFQFDIALEDLQSAVRYMPDHIGTWHLLAWTWLMKDNFQEALSAFEAAYLLDRSFGETHGGLASVYALLGERSKAEKHIKLAEKLDANGFAYIYAKMVLLNKDNQSSEAQSLFDLVMQTRHVGLGATPAELITARINQLSEKHLPN